MKNSTTKGKECPYDNDWPWRLIVPITRLVEGPIRKPRSFFSPSEPHPLSIGLVLLLLYGGVGSVAAAIQGILLTNKTADDYFTILAAILLPLGGVIAFSFYRRVFATFDKLHSDGVLIEVEPPAVSKFKYRLNRGFNAVPPQPVFAALVLFGLHDWPKSMLEGRLQGSLAALHPAVQFWHMSVAFLAGFSLVFFAWKCLVL